LEGDSLRPQNKDIKEEGGNTLRREKSPWVSFRLRGVEKIREALRKDSGVRHAHVKQRGQENEGPVKQAPNQRAKKEKERHHKRIFP